MTRDESADEIRRALAIVCEAGSVIELRIPKADRAGTISGYYNDLDTLTRDAARFDGRRDLPGIYITPNPVNKELLARAINRFEERVKHATADADIIARRWLLVDFDPVRPAGVSSTDAEHDAARTLARGARAWLVELGVPRDAMVLADSGNGAHLLVRVDLPNDVAALNLCKRCLAALDSHLSTRAVLVDPTTHNASRVWKLYGTTARKGDCTTERPHRRTRLLEVPEPLAVTPTAVLVGLAALAPRPTDRDSHIGPCSERGPIARYRNHTITKIAGRLRWEGHDVPTLRQELHAINAARCVPPLPAREVERIVKSIGHKPTGPGTGAVSREAFERCRARVQELRRLSLSIPWPGRSGTTDLNVLHGLYAIAFVCGRLEVQASLRQIAEKAGVESFRTAGRAAKRLEQRGWLKRTRRGSYSLENSKPIAAEPSAWRLTRPRRLLQTGHINAASGGFNEPVCNATVSTEPGAVSFNVSACNSFTADVWRRGALGPTAHRVWCALSADHVRSAAEVARALGCHRSTVTRILREKLVDYVVHAATGWRRTEREPELAYQRLERQRRQHEYDRERFAETREHLRKRRAAGRLVMKEKKGIAPGLWLLVTVQTHDARLLMAWIIAARVNFEKYRGACASDPEASRVGPSRGATPRGGPKVENEPTGAT